MQLLLMLLFVVINVGIFIRKLYLNWIQLYLESIFWNLWSQSNNFNLITSHPNSVKNTKDN